MGNFIDIVNYIIFYNSHPISYYTAFIADYWLGKSEFLSRQSEIEWIIVHCPVCL
jgi:hypothetical protein